VNHKENYKRIFTSLREGIGVEFKANFNWASRSSYAKSIVSFGNRSGGYLIFGVSNKPRAIVGLSNTNFEDLEEEIITTYLNSLLSPEIQYEKMTTVISGKKLGIIYTYENNDKPIIPIKNDGDVKEAEIYYRYNAKSEKIKYPELRALFVASKEIEKRSWKELFERIAKIGPTNTGIMDMVQGKIEGKGNSLLIDSKLVEKLKFIKEGRFSEKGKPTLKLIGEVLPVNVTSPSGLSTSIRVTDNPDAIEVREETILKQYPLTYPLLITFLKKRYKNLVLNQKFHTIRKPLMVNPIYCRTRYLNPDARTGLKKDYYSKNIVKEFDKHYEKKD
jgi:Putative DNA-binding domain